MQNVLVIKDSYKPKNKSSWPSEGLNAVSAQLQPHLRFR